MCQRGYYAVGGGSISWYEVVEEDRYAEEDEESRYDGPISW